MIKLVTLEQAKKLKELGCKLLTHAYYSFDEKLRFHTGVYDWNTYASKDTYAVPTIAKALEWFREVKGIHNWIIPLFKLDKVYYGYRYFDMKDGKPFNRKELYLLDTHQEAESALLDAIIEYMSK